MRVRVTVYYGEEGQALTKETRRYQLLTQDEDLESYDEALDYLTEAFLDPYNSDGYEFEDDEEEAAVGTDYLAAVLLPEWFDDREEAKEFLMQAIRDADQVLADLE
jgi:hypothetical protein